MSIVTLTEFRANIAHHFDKVEEDRKELIVTRQNHEPLAVLPLAELEGLKETLHQLSNRANAAFLDRSIKQLDDGDVVAFDLAMMKPSR